MTSCLAFVWTNPDLVRPSRFRNAFDHARSAVIGQSAKGSSRFFPPRIHAIQADFLGYAEKRRVNDDIRGKIIAGWVTDHDAAAAFVIVISYSTGLDPHIGGRGGKFPHDATHVLLSYVVILDSRRHFLRFSKVFH